MGVGFKQLTLKEFKTICNDISERTFNTTMLSDKTLIIKFKWYINFVLYVIELNRIKKLSQFGEVVESNNYFDDDGKIALKLFDNIKTVLSNKFTFIDINDIKDFCKKVETEIKV